MAASPGGQLEARRRELVRTVERMTSLLQQQPYGLSDNLLWLLEAARTTQKLDHVVRHIRFGQGQQVIATDETCIGDANFTAMRVFHHWVNTFTPFCERLGRVSYSDPQIEAVRRQLCVVMASDSAITSGALKAALTSFASALGLIETPSSPQGASPSESPQVQRSGNTSTITPQATKKQNSRPLPVPAGPGKNKLQKGSPQPTVHFPYARPANFAYASDYICQVCRAKLVHFRCVTCGRLICPRCGTCSLQCETRYLRREAMEFGAFKESKLGLIPEERWIEMKRTQQETVGRALDFDVDPRYRSRS